MVLRNSGRVGSRRFTESLQDLIVLEAFFSLYRVEVSSSRRGGVCPPEYTQKGIPK